MQLNKSGTSKFDTNGNNNSFRIVSGSDFVYDGTSALALTAAGGILTYAGAARAALVILSTSYEPSANTAAPTVGLGIAYNGDLVGTTIFGDAESAAGVESGNVGIGNVPSISITAQRRVTLNNGDTLSPVGAKELGDTDLTLTGMTMSVFLL